MTTDEEHAKILAAVELKVTGSLSANQQKSVWGYGPVLPKSSGNRRDCYVLMDRTSNVNLPNQPFNVDVGGGQNRRVKLVERKKKKYKLFGSACKITRRNLIASSIAMGSIAVLGNTAIGTNGLASDVLPNLPMAPPGPLMGGDAIFNSEYRNSAISEPYWGTVAFVTSGTAEIRERGTTTAMSVGTSCLSSAHVLYHENGGTIETDIYPTGFGTADPLPDWPADWPPPASSSAKWADLAASNKHSSIPARTNEIRGLGVLEGVAAPEFGDVVGKYGATSGLSVARDIGLVLRRLPDEQADEFYLIRTVSGQFSAPGDSGAAVVHIGLDGGTQGPKYRKLAGFVLGGTPEDDEQWYLPAVPFGQPSSISKLDAIEVKL